MRESEEFESFDLFAPSASEVSVLKSAHFRNRNLSAKWLNRSIPFSASLAEEDGDYTKLFASGRLKSRGLARNVGNYWRDLYERDPRVFYTRLLRSLGVAYGVASDRLVYSPSLARALRDMGIPARSELMALICQNLEWRADGYVSLRRLVNAAGPLEEDDDEEYLQHLEDAPINEEKLIFESQSAEGFTPAMTQLITELHSRFQAGLLSPKQVVNAIHAVTGSIEKDRLTTVYESHSDREKITRQEVLLAAFRDLQEKPERKFKAGPRPSRHASTSTSSSGLMAKALESGSDDEAPGNDVITRLHDTLLWKTPFPKIPISSDMTFLRDLSRGVATGWISSTHFKELLDLWEVSLNGSLAQCLKDISVKGKCSVKALWQAIVVAMEDTGHKFT